MTIGLRIFWPSHPPVAASSAVSQSSGQSFAYSFLPTTPRDDAVAVQLGVPSHKGPQRTHTSKLLPGLLSLAGYFHQRTSEPVQRQSCHAWHTKKKRSCRKKRWPEFDVNAIVGLVELSRKIAADAALALLYASI